MFLLAKKVCLSQGYCRKSHGIRRTVARKKYASAVCPSTIPAYYFLGPKMDRRSHVISRKDPDFRPRKKYTRLAYFS